MKPIFIIAGEKGTGKTFFLQKLAVCLSGYGYQLKGFCSIHDRKNDRYFVLNIQTGEKELLMTRTTSLIKKTGQFHINEAAIHTGTGWMNPEAENNSTILVLDEIGPYELKGMIWSDLFTKAVESQNPFIFTTKSKLLSPIMDKWKIHPAEVFYPPGFSSPEKTAAQIVQAIKPVIL